MPRYAKSVISLFLAALAACGPEQAVDVDAAASSGGIVPPRGHGGEPATLDPHRNEENSGAEILRDLFEGLTTETADARIVPGTLPAWTISDDGLVYTFSLPADGLGARLSREPVGEQRRVLMQAAEKRVLEACPTIAPYFHTDEHLVKPSVREFHVGIMDPNHSRHFLLPRNSNSGSTVS